MTDYRIYRAEVLEKMLDDARVSYYMQTQDLLSRYGDGTEKLGVPERKAWKRAKSHYEAIRNEMKRRKEGGLKLARLNKRNTHIVFTIEESEAEACPICQAQLDFDSRICNEDEITDRWSCPECKANGVRKSHIGFVGHLVRKDSIPEDARAEYAPIQAKCLNGTIRKGSPVLLMTEDPCLAGRVTGIEPVSLDGSCEVHVDCTFDYSGDRMTDLENRSLYLNGRYIPYDEMQLSDRIFPANRLLCLDHLTEPELWQVRNSEEDALRCACRIMAEMFRESETKPDAE